MLLQDSLHLTTTPLSQKAHQIEISPNRCGKRVYLFPTWFCLTANPIALFDPTTIANFFALVNPV
jgi:hypothetical protein